MKTFFKDLWALQMESVRFCKKHPIGIIVWTIGSGVAGWAAGTVYIKVQEKKEEREYIEELKKHEFLKG